MATRRKVTAIADTVSIHDACLKYMTTEQGLRLALSNIRPDDFDTVKAISELDLEAIAAYFQPRLPDEASSTSESPENIETLTEQQPNPDTEQPQSTLFVSQQQQQLASPAQIAYI